MIKTRYLQVSDRYVRGLQSLILKNFTKLIERLLFYIHFIYTKVTITNQWYTMDYRQKNLGNSTELAVTTCTPQDQNS